jgi:phosphatidylserine decarboxylase
VSFAREGLVFILSAAAISAAAYIGAVRARSWPLWLTAFVLTLLTLWVAYFFRDPERTGERGPHVVIAPADGRVVHVVEVDEPAFMQGRAIRVSIFMNVFNVHVNRYPSTGTVKYLHYNPGKFLNAATEKSSLENEQSSVGIETSDGRVMMRQIAGLIARRIITYSKIGDAAEQGQRMGLIRFGSRVDVFLPAGTPVEVKVGDHTVAGTTVIARFGAQGGR